MAMLLDRSGMGSRYDMDQSVLGSDMLDQSMNISHLSPRGEISPNKRDRFSLTNPMTRSGILPRMNTLSGLKNGYEESNTP
jgi:hypothetical protein